jgi:hypothetical protein
MPGDIIYGEGSPFVPEESPLSDKALKILSNKGANQFFGEGLSDAQIQKRADDLFPLGLGLTKVTKEDGKVLYTVVPLIDSVHLNLKIELCQSNKKIEGKKIREPCLCLSKQFLIQ